MGEDTQTGALLTPTLRELLTEGPGDEMSDAAERMARKRARDRIRKGLADFATVVRHLDDEELDRAFEEDLDGQDPEELLPYLVAFMFRHHSVVEPSGHPQDFEVAVTDGVEIGAAAMGSDATPRVDIQVPIGGGIDEVVDRLETEGVAAVSMDDLRKLRDAGEITPERFNELYVEKNEQLKEQAREKLTRSEAGREGDAAGPGFLGAVGPDELPYIIEEWANESGSDNEEQ